MLEFFTNCSDLSSSQDRTTPLHEEIFTVTF